MGSEAETIEAVGAGAEPLPDHLATTRDDGAPTLTDRLHNWLPIAIVLVSVLAAVMGWQASLAEESATHTDALARQNFVSQQSVMLQKVQGVDSDLRLFGSYEQYSLMGQALLADSGKVGGAQGQALTEEGQGDIQVAHALGGQFADSTNYSPVYPENYNDSYHYGQLQGTGTYLAGSPYPVAATLLNQVSSDASLTSLEPDRLQARAEDARAQAVKLVGLAALFIAALVLFTLAAVNQGVRTAWFSVSGVAIAAAGLVLFPIVGLA